MDKEDLFDVDNIRLDWKTVIWSLKMAWKVNSLLFGVWVLMQLVSAIFPALFTEMVSRTLDSVNTGISEGLGMDSMVGMLAALTVIMIGNSIFTQLPNIFWMKLLNDFNIGMQRMMGQFMRTVPVRYFDDERTAKIMQIAQRKERGFGLFVGNFMEVVRNAIFLISMLVLAIRTSWVLVLVMAVYTAVVLWIGTKSAKEAYAVDKELQDDLFFCDYYMNMMMKKNPKDIRLLQMADYIIERWKKHRSTILDADNALAGSSERNWAIVDIVAQVCKCILLFGGLFLMKNRYLTLGSLTVFLTVLSQIGNTCMGMGYIWKRFYANGCDMMLKKQMLEWDFSKKRPLPEKGLPMPIAGGNGETEPIFELRDVSFSYEDGKNVLEHISMCVREGESVALVGENGAGKSTLVKLLLGIYEPDDGELYYKGTNYRDLDMSEFVNDIGVVFQDFVHFELLARENIAFGDISKVMDDDALNRAAELGGADRVLAKLPLGLDNYLGRWYEKAGGEMSGGEWQRMAVSRAYISCLEEGDGSMAPEGGRRILIMDEPAAALDPIAEMEQFSRIQNKLARRTSVLISHRIGFARMADKIVVLSGGHIAECGQHEELMQRHGLYYEMFSSQASWYRNGGASNE